MNSPYILFCDRHIKVQVLTRCKIFGCSLLLLLTIALSCAVSAQSGRVQATPTPTPDDAVKVETEEIKLNVLAFDVNGDFYRGVTANDIVITENNILHPPASVRRIPANVLIVMDTGGELRSVKSLDRTRRVARALINSLQPEDSVAIMHYSDTAELIDEWTTDRARTRNAIESRSKFGRRSAFVDAVVLAIDLFKKLPVDNRQLVLITDGTDSLGRSSAKFDAFQSLLSTDISVHVLSYAAMESDAIEPRTKGISKSPPPKAMPDEVAQQLPNGAKDVATAPRSMSISLDRSLIKRMKQRKLELDIASEDLEKLSQNTNGVFISPYTADEMELKAPLVARMIDSAYVITYTPKIPVTETRGTAERKIEVTSKRSGLIVQARRKLIIRTVN